MKSALHLPDNVRLACWTDSKVVLSWIKGSPSIWKMFVANRVAEIQTLTSSSNWSYCPGKDNPADLMTRGVLADQLLVNNMWLRGPTWLSNFSCFLMELIVMMKFLVLLFPMKIVRRKE